MALQVFLEKRRAVGRAEGQVMVVSMGGGVYRFGKEDCRAFLNAAALDPVWLRDSFLVQRPYGEKGEMPFFADLDCTVPPDEETTAETWAETWRSGDAWSALHSLILFLLERFDRPEAQVAVSQPTRGKMKGDHVATGVHLVTNVCMTPGDCFSLYRICVDYMEEHYRELGERMGSWSVVIDAAMYGPRCTSGSGLRMPYSRKDGESDIVYELTHVFKGRAEVDISSWTLREKIGALSIWPTEECVKHKVKGVKRSKADETEVDVGERVASTVNGAMKAVFDGLIARYWSARKYSGDPPSVYQVIFEKDTYILVTRSRRCPIKKAEHRSNHVYFLLSRKGMRLKCHDTRCKNLCGPYVNIFVPGDLTTLFP